MTLYSLKGLGSTSKYIALNNPFKLLFNLSHFTGYRKIAEGLFLYMQSCLFKSKLKVESSDIKIDQLLDFGKPDNGFFMDTSWYKNTYIVGIIQVKDNKYFLKYFKNEESALVEKDNTLNFIDICKDKCVLAKLLHINKNVVWYEWIKQHNEKPKIDNLASLAVELALSQSQTNSDSLDKFRQDVFFKFVYWEKHISLKNMFDEAISKLFMKPNLTYPLKMAHGDFTTRNSFLNENGRIVLIDYERVGLRVEFCDLFHLYFQENIGGCFTNNLNKIKKYLPCNGNDHELYLMSVYFLEEIKLDLFEDKRTGGFTKLNLLIETKILSFIELIKLC